MKDNKIDEYDEAIAYLESLETFGWQPGLQRIEKLLSILGSPQNDYQSIHVGGTNGKGSVTVTLAKILKDQGYKVGQFISPDMFDFRERIQFNGNWTEKASLVKQIRKIKEAISQMVAAGDEHPTNFEVSTALAFLYFSEKNIDIAVVEVGLGGAIDSTNVITPLISVITNVTMDHKEYLGNTEEEIAKVKAGIIKNGVPVVTGSLDSDVLKVIEEKAKSCGSKVYRIGYEFSALPKSFSKRGSYFIFQNKDWEKRILFSLVGHHQVRNGALALETIWCLKENGLIIDEEKMRGSMEHVLWPGRLELIEYKGKRILLDAAHNVDGAKHLGLALKSIYPFRKFVFVLGILGDKQRQEMMQYLGPVADAIVVTKPNSPRAGDYEIIATLAKEYVSDVILEPNIEEAVAIGLSKANENDIVCITGSIYMIKEARHYFKGGLLK
ncbi:hypothetical protein AZF37_05880 [endosymbiont 'TC1' of Trimyema compressum]|uniref:bifunctional folylpolyglutamate synthase/dihydrofolate synthase n=1 Tax=endosymbiont 'TC1' of Trimyema compressum TaxID=243899 RepID=UPI0007F0835A|nr:folylpolyglutamate synthase/dihydrofolate synthase family protein [endosymbiont 'TC1' of Trimyema compressum]AMP20769.1 hypothetical protein AZF37_05880 [endosymbiont 'TC1' of Trimyema compressum]